MVLLAHVIKQNVKVCALWLGLLQVFIFPLGTILHPNAFHHFFYIYKFKISKVIHFGWTVAENLNKIISYLFTIPSGICLFFSGFFSHDTFGISLFFSCFFSHDTFWNMFILLLLFSTHRKRLPESIDLTCDTLQIINHQDEPKLRVILSSSVCYLCGCFKSYHLQLPWPCYVVLFRTLNKANTLLIC